jgi:GWxTD domain-containing protein
MKGLLFRKYRAYFSIFAVCLSFFGFHIAAKANNVEVSVTYATFKGTPKNYIELYLTFVGKSVKQVQIDSINSRGSVEITVLFKQNDNIVLVDKYRLNSPPSLDPVNFGDLRRYPLDNGAYDLEITMQDANAPSYKAVFRAGIAVAFGGNETLQQSDIMLLADAKADSSTVSPFVKQGFFMEPLPYNFYERNLRNLVFYYEIYNTQNAIKDDFLLTFFIQKAYSDGVNEPKPLIIGHKRCKSAAVVPILQTMELGQLESGNYKLIIQIHSRTNEFLAQSECYFQRSNPFIALNSVGEVAQDTMSTDGILREFVGEMSDETLRYDLRAISMLVPPMDADALQMILKNDDIMARKRYLYNFWFKRSPKLPESAHDQYMFVAKAIDKQYRNGFGYGFETDRGRIYLKYGRPNDIITVEDENSAPPYEIWVYNNFELTKQTGVKFLFYNPSLVPNGHRLLHSNCRVELQNPRWQFDLYKNAPNERQGANGTDGTTMSDNFNRRAERLFNDN